MSASAQDRGGVPVERVGEEDAPPFADGRGDRTDAERARAERGRQLPCGRCGAMLEYVPGTRTLLCVHCGGETPIDPSDAPVVEHDYAAAIEQAARPAEGMDRLGECLQLRPVDTVALEQDHAGRRQGEQKLTLRRGELRAGDAHHRGAGYGPAPGGQTHWAIGPTMKH